MGDNFNLQVGKRIAERRKEIGITQTELAVRLGKKLRTIQKYESGEIDLSISTLKRISEILGAPMNRLIG